MLLPRYRPATICVTQAKDRKGKDLYTRKQNDPPQRDGLVDWEKLMGTITANRSILASRPASLVDGPGAVGGGAAGGGAAGVGTAGGEGASSSAAAPPSGDAQLPEEGGAPP